MDDKATLLNKSKTTISLTLTPPKASTASLSNATGLALHVPQYYIASYLRIAPHIKQDKKVAGQLTVAANAYNFSFFPYR